MPRSTVKDVEIPGPVALTASSCSAAKRSACNQVVSAFSSPGSRPTIVRVDFPSERASVSSVTRVSVSENRFVTVT